MTKNVTLTLGGKQLTVEGGPEGMAVSDGSHTFDELYAHRYELFIALCRIMWFTHVEHRTAFSEVKVWRSKLHSDGTSYVGWFVLGLGTVPGQQITYHLPLARWEDTWFALTLERVPEWDGHSPADVLERLRLLRLA